MQIGHHHGHNQFRFAERGHAAEAGHGRPARGDAIVARNDKDGDGMLSIPELENSRIGRKLSIDRFARMDADGDNMLTADELNKGFPGRRKHAGMMEQVMMAKLADHLTEKMPTEEEDNGIAARVLAKLDKDDSGGLNSEEIAGTRLAEKIGDQFYALDGDKNGALDKAELTDFILNHLLGEDHDAGSEDTADTTPEVGAPVETTGVSDDAHANSDIKVAATAATDPLADAIETADVPQAEPVSAPQSSQSFAASYADQIRTSFEASLEILRNGSTDQSPYDIVNALYSEVKGILDAA